jgi:hypothetical protein
MLLRTLPWYANLAPELWGERHFMGGALGLGRHVQGFRLAARVGRGPREWAV